ncbi:MAG: aminodeoxychorismate/anthranilate synthase component II [Acidobacteria bacterium]|nr:aminodeoxychorismate/anthranilate synthase component II [Acidobacteriota bacterium]
MIAVIDNYDSFTHNLVQYAGSLGQELVVYRNDAVTVDAIVALDPAAILISPGPGTPDQAGITLDLIRRCAPSIPILGVCLGHQAIGQAFGGEVRRAPYLMHGKVSDIYHDGKTVFRGLPSPFSATRYHSLIVDRKTLPDSLEVSAETSDGLVMGLRHLQYPCEGVQFHPESVMTGAPGFELIRNFVSQFSG